MVRARTHKGWELVAWTIEAQKVASPLMDPPVVFQRGTMLMRVAHLPETVDLGGIAVPRGTATLMELKNAALRVQLAEAARWQKSRKEGE